MKKVGIYSGVFDPVHHGHISFARKAAHELGLDKVFFMPEARPRRKENPSDIRHRLNMVWLALQEHANLDVIHHHHEQFSIKETLPWLEQKFKDAELHLLMGTDLFDMVHTWPDFEQLKNQVKFVVGHRDGHLITRDIAHHPVTTDLSALSSTIVRDAGSFAQAALVPDQVAQYIRHHQLYR